jgi:hypothetical protein
MAIYSAVPDWLKKLLFSILVLAIVFVAGDIRGKRVARAQCEAQAQRAQTAADKQDLQAEKEGRAQDLEITNALTQQKKVDDETIAKLQAQIKQRPTSAPCVYDKSTADPELRRGRLRN